ncbi:MAG: MFS transporter [Leptospiraceae bacterium]|nr:MFS transporter [Leptospiraceae bacterium]
MKKRILNDRRIYIIFSITLIAVMGVASLTPAFPKIAESLQLNKVQVGWLISAFTFPGIFLSPVVGVIADRWGRKMVLVPSLFLFAGAGFTIFFVHHFQTMILLRILQGMGAASLGSLNTTLIGDFFKGEQRPEAMGFNASVLSLSTAFYPLIGGALAGMNWYYPFLLPLLAIPVGLLVIFGMEEPEIVKPEDFRQYLSSMAKSVMRIEVIAIFILSVLTFVILYGAFLTYLPFLLNQKFHLLPQQIGILFSLSSLTTAFVATRIGKLNRKFGSLKLLKTAFLLYFIVTLILPSVNHLYLFILPIVIFGIAQALNIPSLQTSLANLAPDNQRAVFMSINGTVLRLGQTLGPLIIGIGFSWQGLSGAYYLASFMSALGLLVLFTMMSESLSKSPVDIAR